MSRLSLKDLSSLKCRQSAARLDLYLRSAYDSNLLHVVTFELELATSLFAGQA